jgi:DNA-binding protein YbaB
MRNDMQTQIGAVLEEYRATRSRIDLLQAAMADVTATVQVPGRSATATVDGHGELRDLRLDPDLVARLDIRQLERGIMLAVQLATMQARARAQAMMREALPTRLGHLVRTDGSLDLTELLPDDLGDLGDLDGSWDRRP